MKVSPFRIQQIAAMQAVATPEGAPATAQPMSVPMGPVDFRLPSPSMSPSLVDAMIRRLESPQRMDALAELAGNPSLSVGTIRRWAEQSLPYVEASLARNPATPADVMKLIYWRQPRRESTLFQDVMRHPNAPKHVVERDLQRDDLRDLALANPRAPMKEIQLAAQYGNFKEREGLARNPSTPEPLLRKYASERTDLEALVLANPSCPSDLLRAAMTTPEKLAHVLQNPGLKRPMFELLLAMPLDDMQVLAVMNHPAIPLDLLESLHAAHPHWPLPLGGVKMTPELERKVADYMYEFMGYVF